MSKQIAELNRRLDRLLSKKQVFVRGVIRGIGIAVGTTIIAAIIFSILGAVLTRIDNKPLIKNFINSEQ